jgi:two-component system, OmpR family, sensor histidine kinase CiaH
MFRSLRVRLAVSYAFVTLVILAVLGTLVLVLLSRNLDHAATDQLEAQAAAQVERIEEGGPLEPTGDVDTPSATAIQLAVYAAGDPNPVGEAKENPSWLRAYPDRVTDLTVAGEQVRVVTLPATTEGRTIALVAAGRSLASEATSIDRVRSLLLWGGLLALGASIAAGWWWAGRAVEPVRQAYEAQAGFAADASHELRSPLTFIRAGVETLAERDPELGADVLAEVDYLTGVSQRLLQLARADRGRLDLERSPVRLASACRSAAHRSIEGSGTRVTAAGDDEVIVSADRIALEAALDAVLENVGRHGGGEADLGWERRDGRAVITVQDHGPGIPPELHHRAFDRFFRADPSRARDTGGAGLGLALARSLVEAQSGRMWLEPTPGGGVTAKISLPVA